MGRTIRIYVVLIPLLATALVVAAAQQTSGVVFIHHNEVLASRPAGKMLALTTESGKADVFVVTRGAGRVEVHEKARDVFFVMEGEATFVTGGRLVGREDVGPGEVRGSDLQGGQTHHLTKGDFITVPAATPHWFKDVPTKTITLYVAKISLE